MREDWKAFLQDVGAEFDDQVPYRVRDYGTPQDELHLVRNGLVIADLSHNALIGVHDAEAATFLQGQFTNDIQSVSETHSQRSAWCSAKGRVLATMRIVQRGESYYLHLPMELAESTLKRLRMFVMRAKVTVEDDSAAWVQFGLAGNRADELLASVAGEIPREVDACVTHPNFSLVRLAGERPRFLILCSPDHAQKLWTQLQVQARPVGAFAWRLLKIRAGVPQVRGETQEAFVPQMLNFEVLNGVSFTKGCYPGQEVVARMQYLGTLKRRMFPILFKTDAVVTPGTELHSPGSKSGQGAGKIVDAQRNGDGEWEGLAVLEMAASERGDVFLDEAQTIPITIGTLPYALPDPEADKVPRIK
ncbi:MAG: YgfZ/GcvT domain-containing protein [Gammaproteobacteria bacterium]|jgi:folate-binding protein YgfZ